MFIKLKVGLRIVLKFDQDEYWREIKVLNNFLY